MRNGITGHALNSFINRTTDSHILAIDYKRNIMDTALLNWLISNKKIVGFWAIIICIFAWASELTDLVYVCPYCRAQRSIIGILGLSLLLPNPRNWINLYFSSCIAAFGFYVASHQHFAGWKKIMGGTFEWGESWYINPWLLSGCALFIISGLLLLIWSLPNTSKKLSSE
jgi:hypothetical protein